MNMYDIIYKKRQGEVLSREEIEYFVKGYTDGSIPDYQASAFLMTIFFNKMNSDETYILTDAMRHSGDVVDLSDIKGIKVDKHSTGGVGDKTTFIVGPLAAAWGIPIAKMSGRGLGFTGGTVDKMEAIPGFKTSLTEQEFIDLVNRVGLSVIGQTGSIAPADKKIYALRDVTATVDDLSLITGSIMSKKLAAGTDAIVLDVKCGRGAFVETLEEAEELSRTMVDIGNADGKKTVALITDMNQPLGKAVGNSLEVIEAIETLKGNGPEDIEELSVILAGYMIFLGGKAKDPEEGKKMAKEAIAKGTALEKMKLFLEGQGADPSIIDDYTMFPQSKYKIDYVSEEAGYIQQIDASKIGMASQHAGAGREKKEDEIDLSAGIYLYYKVGDLVEKGDSLFTIYGNNKEKLDKAVAEAASAYSFGQEKPSKNPIVLKVVE